MKGSQNKNEIIYIMQIYEDKKNLLPQNQYVRSGVSFDRQPSKDNLTDCIN